MESTFSASLNSFGSETLTRRFVQKNNLQLAYQELEPGVQRWKVYVCIYIYVHIYKYVQLEYLAWQSRLPTVATFAMNHEQLEIKPSPAPAFPVYIYILTQPMDPENKSLNGLFSLY